jgi:hypothetical protein
MTKFDEWLKNNGFEKEIEERYTINRIYLYKLWLDTKK